MNSSLLLLFTHNFVAFILSSLLFISADKLLFDRSGDIGNCQVKGSVQYDKSTATYTLIGGGENMWASADDFFMVWREESGDFSFSTTLAFENKEGNAHKKMGLMIRESLNGNSKYVDVVVHGDGLTSLQYRSETGGITKEITTLTRDADHIVLARTGNKFIMKTATGKYPQQITGELELDFSDTYYVGMFVCAHEAGTTRKAYFSEVSYQKTISGFPEQTEKIEEGSVIYGTDGKTPAGIVFHYDSSTGKGYMVSLENTQTQWGDMGVDMEQLPNYINSAQADKDFSGIGNTVSIIAQLDNKTDYAARWCYELRAGGFTDWYLPSCGELNLLLSKKRVVDAALMKIGLPRITGIWHWSSSEGDGNLSWNINFSGGDIYPADKNAKKHVRAIRAF